MSVFPRMRAIPICEFSGVLTKPDVEAVASRMLAETGITVIWEAHVAAAAAHRLGRLEMAASLIEIAEAAERLWSARATTTATD